MLKLTVDLWNSSLEIEARIMHKITGEFKKLPIVFDTGIIYIVNNKETYMKYYFPMLQLIRYFLFKG